MILFDTFKETIFLKTNSDLYLRYQALETLIKKYPNNGYLKEEMFLIKKGLDGENEIEYQLKKSNIGMFVLRDVNFKFEDLTAQVDYIILTKAYAYFIECKNLIGNITVNESGNFVREYSFNNKKIKKGMYSPIRQVEAQLEVYKKIWLSKLNKLEIILNEKKFDNTYKTLVVAANKETILNLKYAPKDIKYKVLKTENLVKQLEYDIDHSDKDFWSNKKFLQDWGYNILSRNVNNNVDYIEYYKNKFNIKELNLKDKLIEFRLFKSKKMNVPPYYIFSNDELDKILENNPKTLDELKNILPEIKLKLHGQDILNIILDLN